MNKNITIAIDGPVGSGKGTLAVALAKKINALFVYTGAMYRELAFACVKEKIDIKSEDQVLEVLNKISIELQPTEKGIRAFLNGEDVSDKIFQPDISRLTPIVAAFPRVRKEMVLKQRKIAQEAMKNGKGVVMEGRDITTNVLPDADIKIYLTADINIRTQRRLKQLAKKEVETSFDEVLKDIEERDRLDSQRKASPLKIVPDAYIIDTTRLTVEETRDKVIEKLKEKDLYD